MAAIVSHTSRAFALEDDQLVRCEGTEFRTSTLDNDEVTPQLRELEYDLEQIELGGHPHFMHKEIYEQPEALERSLRGRIDLRRAKWSWVAWPITRDNSCKLAGWCCWGRERHCTRP